MDVLRPFLAKVSAENNLKLSAAVFNDAAEGILITDTAGRIVSANAAATRITGYSSEELLGKKPHIFKSGRHNKVFYRELWNSIHLNNQWEGEIWKKRRNGEIYPERLRISAIKNAQGCVQNYIGFFIDISKQKEAENHLTYLAFHDPVTGLANHELFHYRLTGALLQAKQSQTICAVLFIELDNSNDATDTLGHTTGDLLPQKTTLLLTACLRENHTLARIEHNKFIVLLQNFNNRDDIALTARKINEPLNANIGISCFPTDSDNASVLIKQAEMAMHSAMNDDREIPLFFQARMDRDANNRIEMEQQLRHALENGEFRVLYQPQFKLRSQQIVGVKALLRWQRTEVESISSDQFIQLAEETGLILPIWEWMLREVATHHRAWQKVGWRNLRIAVDLPCHQFKQTKLSSLVGNILKETGLKPVFVDLELTEIKAMQDAEASLQKLKTLRHCGVRISVNGFGSGYSSLSYLKQFPIDSLKIASAIIATIENDPNAAAVVVAIIALGHRLGLEVVAEGVETEAQLKFLKMHGCNEALGCFLGPPAPADKLTKLLLAMILTTSA